MGKKEEKTKQEVQEKLMQNERSEPEASPHQVSLAIFL